MTTAAQPTSVTVTLTEAHVAYLENIIAVEEQVEAYQHEPSTVERKVQEHVTGWLDDAIRQSAPGYDAGRVDGGYG